MAGTSYMANHQVEIREAVSQADSFSLQLNRSNMISIYYQLHGKHSGPCFDYLPGKVQES